MTPNCVWRLSFAQQSSYMFNDFCFKSCSCRLGSMDSVQTSELSVYGFLYYSFKPCMSRGFSLNSRCIVEYELETLFCIVIQEEIPKC